MALKSTGDPAKGRNCLGMADLMREPLPPATIMASFETESIEVETFDMATRLYFSENGPHHDKVHHNAHDGDAKHIACEKLERGVRLLIEPRPASQARRHKSDGHYV